MFTGKIQYKWWFSIVMLNYQRIHHLLFKDPSLRQSTDHRPHGEESEKTWRWHLQTHPWRCRDHGMPWGVESLESLGKWDQRLQNIWKDDEKRWSMMILMMILMFWVWCWLILKPNTRVKSQGSGQSGQWHPALIGPRKVERVDWGLAGSHLLSLRLRERPIRCLDKLKWSVMRPAQHAPVYYFDLKELKSVWYHFSASWGCLLPERQPHQPLLSVQRARCRHCVQGAQQGWGRPQEEGPHSSLGPLWEDPRVHLHQAGAEPEGRRWHQLECFNHLQ